MFYCPQFNSWLPFFSNTMTKCGKKKYLKRVNFQNHTQANLIYYLAFYIQNVIERKAVITIIMLTFISIRYGNNSKD